MEPARLKLVGRSRPEAAGAGGRGTLLGLSALLLGLAAASGGLGAEAARRPAAARELGEETLRTALFSGSDDPAVHARLLELRRVLGRRPLDSATRSVYAGLLLALARGPDDVSAAVYHVEKAVEHAPVTVPVLRTAVLVLAHTGRTDQAARLVRSAFGFDPQAAAAWLARIEPLMLELPVAEAIPDEPAAWLAWSLRLDLAGRHREAREWTEAASARWPDDLAVAEHAGFLALAADRWDWLERIVPPDRELPAVREAATLHVYRARVRARAGDDAGARADIERALELDSRSVNVAIAAGAAHRAAGDVEDARRVWTRALFDLAGEVPAKRVEILEDLAELEDEHGSAAAALRAWRALAEASPEHARARRRIDDLTGFNRER